MCACLCGHLEIVLVKNTVVSEASTCLQWIKPTTPYFMGIEWIFNFYYIKVSGIPSGDKLIKTIRYPHM